MAYSKRTSGFYTNHMSPKAGLIIAENNWSPYAMEGRHCPLEKWSDVVWLDYAATARSIGTSPAGLKYVIRGHIVNADTLSIMRAVCGGSCPSWPGKVFDINQKPGREPDPTNPQKKLPLNINGLALLGNPNGGGVAWVLINHKSQLGRKTPVSVTAWTTSGSDANGNPELWSHLMFQFST